MSVLAVGRRGKRGIENKGADIKRIDQVVILLFAADGDELDDLAVLLADVGRPEGDAAADGFRNQKPLCAQRRIFSFFRSLMSMLLLCASGSFLLRQIQSLSVT